MYYKPFLYQTDPDLVPGIGARGDVVHAPVARVAPEGGTGLGTGGTGTAGTETRNGATTIEKPGRAAAAGEEEERTSCQWRKPTSSGYRSDSHLSNKVEIYRRI